TLDGNGKVIQGDVTDPRGDVRRLTFNAAGYLSTDTRAYGTPLAQTITYVRGTDLGEAHNLVRRITDQLGRTTEYTYDAKGNVLTVTRLWNTPDAVTTTLTYEPNFNQVETITDPLSHTMTYDYDAVGNLTSITTPLGPQTRTTLTHNELGQPLTVT